MGLPDRQPRNKTLYREKYSLGKFIPRIDPVGSHVNIGQIYATVISSERELIYSVFNVERRCFIGAPVIRSIGGSIAVIVNG